MSGVHVRGLPDNLSLEIEYEPHVSGIGGALSVRVRCVECRVVDGYAHFGVSPHSHPVEMLVFADGSVQPELEVP